MVKNKGFNRSRGAIRDSLFKKKIRSDAKEPVPSGIWGWDCSAGLEPSENSQGRRRGSGEFPFHLPPPLSLVFHSFPELFSSNHILLSTLYPSSYTNLFFGVILSSRLCVTGLRIKILIHSMHKNAYVLAVQAGIVGMYIAIKIFPQIHTKILFY